MRRNHAIRAGTIIGLATLMLVSIPASASDLREISIEDEKRLVTALKGSDATPDQIDAVLSNPELAMLIAVDFDSEVIVTDDDYQMAAPWKVSDSQTRAISPMSVGSSCSGTSKAVTRIVYIRNLLGNTLASYHHKTHWCYNSSRVTYATNSHWGNVTTLGTIGGVVYDGPISQSEGFGTWNGKSNGQVISTSQGKFRQTLFKIGTLATLYPKTNTWVRYNGSSKTSATCTGCSL